MTQNEYLQKKKEDTEVPIAQDFDDFMAEMESDVAFLPHKRTCVDATLSRSGLRNKNNPNISGSTIHYEEDEIQFPKLDSIPMISSSASPTLSPFESVEQSDTSESTHGHGEKGVKMEIIDFSPPLDPNLETVATLKRSMAGTSRLIGTFTALKTTYLKLCKEFNFLLSKFNENERIKIELIHENNELRKLLLQTIKEKELDRRTYKRELLAKGKSANTSAIA